MKKLVIVALSLLLVVPAFAGDNYVEGGFEASGSVMAGVGYQYHNDKVGTEAAVDAEGFVTYPGPMGAYLGRGNFYTGAGAQKNTFGFWLDGVELDIAKSFGENIRLRADLDFARALSTGNGKPAFVLEQAYATANIPAGNGIEFLLGRFNAPIGFESIDPIENDTISQSILIRSQMRPTNLTGAKFYYAFSDAVDFHLWVANSIIDDTLNRIANMPAIGARLAYNWGEEGKESTIGLSPFFGPSSTISNRHYSIGVDLDANWWVTEAFALGLEGLYRRDNAIAVGNDNMNTFGGLVNLHYAFSDVWDGTLKYAFAMQREGTNGAIDYIGGGVKQQVHEIALAGGYAVADGAEVKLEGRFDIVNPTGPANNQYVFGAVMGFGYQF